MKMQLRTSARLLSAVGTLLLATTLTSCGFNYATDRVYTPAEGVNERDAQVDVLNGLIVSAQDGSGTFIASFSNNDQTNEASVDALAGAGDDSALEVDDFDPIELAPGALVNLATDGGIPVSGDFAAGNFVSLTITLGDGDTVEIDVPAVSACGSYEGLDISEAEDGATAPEADACGASGAPEEE